jgi:uncharacterized protein (DUF58 family)
MRRPVALAVCAVALVVAGAASPSLALFAAGCALAFVTIGAVACVVAGARSVTISTRVPLREVEEDGALSVFLSSTRPRWWPVQVEALAGGSWRPVGSNEFRIDVCAGRRGARELPPIPVRVVDALGLAELPLGSGSAVRIVALPRPSADEQVVRTLLRRSSGGDAEPGGLRSYVPGTKLSRIHWASLARGGELMQREVSPAPTEAPPLVVVDTHGAVDREAVDRVARAATAAVTRCATHAGCRVLLPGDRRPSYISSDLRGWREVHRRLALLEAGKRASPPRSDVGTSVVSIRAGDHQNLTAAAIRSEVDVGSTVL